MKLKLNLYYPCYGHEQFNELEIQASTCNYESEYEARFAEVVVEIPDSVLIGEAAYKKIAHRNKLTAAEKTVFDAREKLTIAEEYLKNMMAIECDEFVAEMDDDRPAPAPAPQDYPFDDDIPF
jgi:hypothetical protein